jgi:hypothetical protein
MGLGESYLEQKDMRAARAVFERYRLQFPVGRFAGQALLGILTSFEGEGNTAGLVKLGKQWLIHNPRHPDRALVQLKVADALRQAKRDAEAASPVREPCSRRGRTCPHWTGCDMPMFWPD